MIKFIIAGVLALVSIPAFAQFSTNAPTGQTPGGIQQNAFNQNNQATGFSETSLSTIAGAGTTQATAPIIATRTVVITACPASAGVQLPSVQRYSPIAVLNRSGGACLVYPSPNATVESASGTAGAVNAANTQATNTDVIYRPTSATTWLQ